MHACRSTLEDPTNQEEARALTDFLWWATHDGQKIAAQMDYAPLSEGVQKKVEGALKALQFRGTPVLSEGR